jgi:hypothetical protein
MSSGTERILRAYLAYRFAPVYAVLWLMRLVLIAFVIGVVREIVIWIQ